MIGSIGSSGFNPMTQMTPMRRPPDASQLSSELIQQADADGDGLISKSEFSALLSTDSTSDSDTTSASIDALFADADGDGDDALSMDELSASIDSLLEQLRSAAPERRPPPPGEEHEDPFASADVDGSGGLDAAEFTEMLSAGPLGGAEDGAEAIATMFEDADTDGDGQLSKEELDAAMPPPPPDRGPMAHEAGSDQRSDQLSTLVQDLLAQYATVASSVDEESTVSVTA